MGWIGDANDNVNNSGILLVSHVAGCIELVIDGKIVKILTRT